MRRPRLTPLQVRVLDCMACHRGIELREIASDCRTTVAAVSRALRVLAKRRIVYARELWVTTARGANRSLASLPADVQAYIAEQAYARPPKVLSAFTVGEGD